MPAEQTVPAARTDRGPVPPPATPGRAAPARRAQRLLRWETMIAALLVVTALAGQGLSSEFLTWDSFTTASLDLSEVALMALPLALVIVAAEIDLSIASVLALSSAVMAELWNAGLPLEFIMPICLVVGALCGALNGYLVTHLGLPSLAVTIGTLALFRGLAYVVIGDRSVTDFPATWTDRAFGNFAGTAIPNTMILFGALAFAFGTLLHFTGFGRQVYAIGANEEAARFSGIRVRRVKLWLFVMSGTVAALAGIVISLRNSTAAANVGTGFELTTVTAVVLGGVSIFGGRGTIAGVVLALALVGGIQKALQLSESISTYWIQIVTGALLIGSVLGPNLVQRAREARAHAPRTRDRWPSRAGASQTRPQEEKA